MFRSSGPLLTVPVKQRSGRATPRHSMYAIYAYIDPQNHPNVGIHGIHGVSGTYIIGLVENGVPCWPYCWPCWPWNCTWSTYLEHLGTFSSPCPNASSGAIPATPFAPPRHGHRRGKWNVTWHKTYQDTRGVVYGHPLNL